MIVDLAGKTALVTGASSGIGRHFASTLASNGAHVILAARRAALLDDVVNGIRERGGSATSLVLDVTSSPASLAQSLERVGHVDILINNSGVAVNKPLLEQTEEDWVRVLDTNLRGTFFVSTTVARQMRDAGEGGSIINVASIVGLRQAGQVAPYAASKAAVIQLTKTMALELARYSIRVNAIAPGYIQSDLNADFFATDAGQALVRRIPQRRLGQLSDLDGALLLLASEASRYMTGSIIVVDGGHLTSTL